MPHPKMTAPWVVANVHVAVMMEPMQALQGGICEGVPRVAREMGSPLQGTAVASTALTCRVPRKQVSQHAPKLPKTLSVCSLSFGVSLSFTASSSLLSAGSEPFRRGSVQFWDSLERGVCGGDVA
jgi:hypothetical protein